MTKRFERIEAAIAQVTSDIDCTAGQEIRVALQDASEPERDALVKPLTALLRHWRGMERQDSRWWPQRQLAEITLVACEPDSPAMRRRLTLHSDDERLFTMIADRRPAWMTVVMQELLRDEAAERPVGGSKLGHRRTVTAYSRSFASAG